MNQTWENGKNQISGLILTRLGQMKVPNYFFVGINSTRW